MAKKDDLLRAAHDLPADDRVELAHRLWESAEGPDEDAALVERAWTSEILRRSAAVHAGRVKPVTAEAVVARLRERRAASARKRK